MKKQKRPQPKNNNVNTVLKIVSMVMASVNLGLSIAAILVRRAETIRVVEQDERVKVLLERKAVETVDPEE